MGMMPLWNPYRAGWVAALVLSPFGAMVETGGEGRTAQHPVRTVQGDGKLVRHEDAGTRGDEALINNAALRRLWLTRRSSGLYLLTVLRDACWCSPCRAAVPALDSVCPGVL